MAKFKNVSGRDVIVPALGGRLVIDGATVEFGDEHVAGLEGQETNWLPVDTKAHTKENG